MERVLGGQETRGEGREDEIGEADDGGAEDDPMTVLNGFDNGVDSTGWAGVSGADECR